MGKEDIYESNLLDDERVFADLVNGVLYHGEQVVKPEELTEQDGELSSIVNNRMRKTIRDKVRLWKGRAIAVIAVENQTKVDYHMLLRCMLSEGMAYDRQWKKNHLRHKAEKDLKGEEEFLSGMKKEDKFIPVITIVVYYGQEKAWDGARTLHELLDLGEEKDKILPFINDYKLNLFDYHEYEDFKQFRTELQAVFEFLRYAEDKEKLYGRIQKNRGMYESLSSGAKALLARLTKIKEIPGITKKEVKEGKFEMCKAFEDMKEEGRQEGIKEGERRAEKRMCKAFEDMKEEGRQEGIKEGIREGERRAEERMCKAFEDMKEEGRQEGIKEGERRAEEKMLARVCKTFILENLDEKKDEQVIIEKLMKYFSLDSESAGKYFQMYAGNVG